MDDSGWYDGPSAAPSATTGWADSNSTTAPTSTGSSSFSGGGGRSHDNSFASSAPKVSLDVTAQLQVERLPLETQMNDIRATFGRYGRLTRVIMDYRIDEERVYCWMDYDDEQRCDNAIRVENGKKMDNRNILVQKCTGYSGGRGRGGGRRDSGWGTSDSGWSKSSSEGSKSGDWNGSKGGDSSWSSDSGGGRSWSSEGGRGRGGRGRGGRGRGSDRSKPYDRDNRSGGSSWADEGGSETKSSGNSWDDWGGSGNNSTSSGGATEYNNDTKPNKSDWGSAATGANATQPSDNGGWD